MTSPERHDTVAMCRADAGVAAIRNHHELPPPFAETYPKNEVFFP
jgi:hypothetical protein